MTTSAHDPATCRSCYHCRIERELVANGGWEWVDDGREGRTEAPRPAWLALGRAGLAVVATLGLMVLWVVLVWSA